VDTVAFVRWETSFVAIETIIFFVFWLALAILGAGLLLRGWEWLLVSGWGWLLAGVVEFVFWLALAICSAGLLILGRWWLALAIFGGGLLIRCWKSRAALRAAH
jgi:hypothetical protein